MVRFVCAAVAAAIVLSPPIAAAQPVPPARLSVSTGGTEANGASTTMALSRDGRQVLFYSLASNLVAGDTNGQPDFFVRDRDTDRDGVLDEPGAVATIRVSEGLLGEQTTDFVVAVEFSPDGRFVLFSTAAPLIAADTNGVFDVYLRDRDADADGVFDETGAVTVERVSTGTGGTQADGASFDPRMTPDGRFVIFISYASNLHDRPVPAAQFYRKDRLSGVTTIVTATPDGTPAPLPPSLSPVISNDGRYAAFAGGFHGTPVMPPGADVLLRDLALNTLVPIVVPASPPPGVPLTGAPAAAVTDRATISSARPIAFSPDGSRLMVAFTTTVSLAGFGSYQGAIYDYNVAAAQIDRSFAGVDDSRFLLGTRANIDPAIGIAYSFNASALGSCPTEATGRFVYDRRLGRVRQLVGGTLGEPASSADGRRLLYARTECPPAPGPTVTYLWDAAYDTPLPMPDPVRAGWMDAAGTMAIFDSAEATIVTAGGDTNGVTDVFAVDLLSRLDRDTDGLDDRWEVSMGLDFTSNAGADGATGDPDGDGLTNLMEQTAGSHPRAQLRRALAEGAQNAFFKTRLGIANPGPVDATAVVRFDGDNGVSKAINVRVPAGAKRTVFADDVEPPAASFAVLIESSENLVSDRTMSWPQQEYGGHAESSEAGLATYWQFAEGSTGSFALFYLLHNPGSFSAGVTIRYFRPAPLPALERVYVLAPHSRTTLPVNLQLPELAATDVAADIVSTQPILVERAMYRSTGSQPFAAGHASAGVTGGATDWFFAEGATGDFFDMFVLMSNATLVDANVEVRYLLTDGTVLTKVYVVPAESRRTIWVDGEDFGTQGLALANTTFSSGIRVTNGVPIVVERSMWFPGPQVTPDFWTEAHNSPGLKGGAGGRRWALADGESGGTRATQTFVLIANTSPTAGRARITVLPESPTSPASGPAPPSVFTVDLPPNSRTTVSMQDVPGLADTRYGVLVESVDTTPLANLVVERSMYWNADGVTWAAGTNLLATLLP